MSENKKEVEKALEQIKNAVNPNEEQLDQLKNLADNYSEKSQDEIFSEIMQLNKKLSEDLGADEFKNKLSQLEQIKPMLDNEQSERLDKLLSILKSSL
ncbi:hypothetical protein Curi_c09710 [Gottschalkia acidurici 9a]|uniref:Uncharacterized protein n=1 Tax=Gottschalkia acidurici (strain ATCC 7906 / DSM 604 / BCRC 14475 / CIP 104303 / KCTC 5404 / NCIMB 10678 / 9a) TaxID=1128398 RepID=K0AYX0_GOTA9|nr:hypothetical protein [Gottschalkia acidurici]AFS77987.1 hypothetical protein Curi_c09710 [Gottschalkia acidurici 9a]